MNDSLSPVKKAIKKVTRKCKKAIASLLEKMQADKRFAMIIYCAAIAVALIIIILIIVLANKDEQENTTQTADASISENALPVTEAIPEDLQKDAYPEVNALMQTYFAALAQGDLETLRVITQETDERNMLKNEKKSNYVNRYENLAVYTKMGLTENSYVAFVYYEVFFEEYEEGLPSVVPLYVAANADGSLYIADVSGSEEITARCVEVAEHQDVIDLINSVQVRYKEIVDQNEALSVFLTTLQTQLDTEVDAEMAAREQAQAQTPEVPGEPVAETPPVEETPPAPIQETVRATNTVNVRVSDSEQADRLGKVDQGTTITRYEAQENGWSRVDYEGQTAFIKSEYLEVIPGETATNEPADTGDAPADVPTVEGKVTVLETVNIRKSANENGDKLGVAYRGETFDLIMKQADGWTRISYQGQTAYVKSEYVQ